MSAYLLTLAFTKPASAATATGLFASDNTAPGGVRSKVWYTIPAGWPATPLTDPGLVSQAAPLSTWGTPVPDGSLSCALGDSVYVRVAPDSSWGQVGQPVPSLAMFFTLAFGRLASSNHGDATIASPFCLDVDTGTGIDTPLTLFSSPVQGAPATDGAWTYYCGDLAQNAPGQQAGGGPPINTRFCTYSFVISGQATLNNANCYTYGHDPRLVVKG